MPSPSISAKQALELPQTSSGANNVSLSSSALVGSLWGEWRAELAVPSRVVEAEVGACTPVIANITESGLCGGNMDTPTRTENNVRSRVCVCIGSRLSGKQGPTSIERNAEIYTMEIGTWYQIALSSNDSAILTASPPKETFPRISDFSPQNLPGAPLAFGPR